jgi:hypothetical protein
LAPAAHQEERGLLFVPMSRAKHHLALSTPESFHVRQQPRGSDSSINATLARLIEGKVARLFERVTLTPRPVEQVVTAQPPSIDLGPSCSRCGTDGAPLPPSSPRIGCHSISNQEVSRQ